MFQDKVGLAISFKNCKKNLGVLVIRSIKATFGNTSQEFFRHSTLKIGVWKRALLGQVLAGFKGSSHLLSENVNLE